MYKIFAKNINKLEKTVYPFEYQIPYKNNIKFFTYNFNNGIYLSLR